MTTPDVRAFYASLGIELPGWPKLEAPLLCPTGLSQPGRPLAVMLGQPGLRRMELPRMRRPRRRLRRRAGRRTHATGSD
jgi:hypothetical protein